MRDVSVEELAHNVGNPMFADGALGVVFYTKTVEDVPRSAQEGRRCFREREYVKIMVPGDRYNIIDRPVQKTGILPTDDALRFPTQYARFKQREQQQAHDGTPLALWQAMPQVLAEELKFFNVFTVEQLAGLSDTHLAKFPGGSQWKQKASQFVRALTDQAQVAKIQSQLEERDNEIETLKKAVADQARMIEQLRARMEKRER